MSKVSVIIPAYKQAGFLARTIESVRAQTHPDIEIVVIDDGSPDDTPAVAAQFQSDARFRYIRQENTGLAGARNRGIKESTGDYLCFLDSDDLYEPTKVAKQAAVLDRNPDVGFVYCDITTIDENDKPVADQFCIAKQKRELSGDIFPSLMVGGYFPPHTVMIRRSVLDAVGDFDLALGGYADYDLWVRVAGAGHRAVFISESLALYRRHSTNMSKDGQHMGETRLGSLEKAARLFPDKVGKAVASLQDGLADLHIANAYMQRRVEQSPQFQNLAAASAESSISSHDMQFTIAWRAKFEAASALLAANQRPAALKLLLEGVKAVEGCRTPRITLEAVVEIAEKMRPLDPARARHLLGLAAKLAESIRAMPMLERVRGLLGTTGESAGSARPAVGKNR